MIDNMHLKALSPSQRADLIYRQAQSELTQGLWRAALGENRERNSQSATWGQPLGKASHLDSLLTMIAEGDAHRAPSHPTLSHTAPSHTAPFHTAPFHTGPSNAAQVDPQGKMTGGESIMPSHASAGGRLRAEALGPNASHANAINRAAERTGIPATALATIIDAEAGRTRDGTWNVHSRNPRSSAAGLGQFLSGTWEAEAERSGTWLNLEARRRGWLNGTGQVTSDARSSLLALRYDPEASIQATADYAKGNLQRLKRAGVRLDGQVESVARAAYLGHHLGPGDAARFLNGGLDPARARRLLTAQIGPGEAARRLAETGDATDAHRRWFNAYADRRINPDRFA